MISDRGNLGVPSAAGKFISTSSAIARVLSLLHLLIDVKLLPGHYRIIETIDNSAMAIDRTQGLWNILLKEFVLQDASSGRPLFAVLGSSVGNDDSLSSVILLNWIVLLLHDNFVIVLMIRNKIIKVALVTRKYSQFRLTWHFEYNSLYIPGN